MKVVLKVLFFASVREQLGTEHITCAFAPTIDALISFLIDTYGVEWGKILRAPNIIVAVNHEVVSPNYELNDGDEVAFFPPVTGG